MLLSTCVVVSTYNGEKFVLKQLESIKRQILQPDEVIICDDCSTDETYKIIVEFVNKYRLVNWKVFRNDCNKGWRRNFIELVSMTHKDLVFPCDQDDIWYDNKIEKMEEIMRNNSQISVLASFVDEFFENGKSNRRTFTSRGDYLCAVPIANNFMNVLYPGCSYCVRTSFAHMCNKYWKASMPHDGLYWRMGMFLNSLYVLRLPLINQRKHSNSSFTKEAKVSRNTMAKLREINYTFEVIDSIKSMLLENNKVTNKTKNVLDRAYAWNCLRKDLFENRGFSTAVRLIRYLSFYQTYRRFLLDLYIFIMKK